MMQKSIRELATDAGITEKRLWSIEQMPEPRIYDMTKEAIARALGLSAEQLDKEWRTTPVVIPTRAAVVLTSDHDALIEQLRTALTANYDEFVQLLSELMIRENVELSKLVADIRARQLFEKAKSVPTIRSGTDLAHDRKAASQSPAARRKADEKGKPK